MPASSRSRALVALALIVALLGIATWGTAHAWSHAPEIGATASDCGVCQAVTSGKTDASTAPALDQPAPQARPFTLPAPVDAQHQVDLVNTGSRAPPLA